MAGLEVVSPHPRQRGAVYIAALDALPTVVSDLREDLSHEKPECHPKSLPKNSCRSITPGHLNALMVGTYAA